MIQVGGRSVRRRFAATVLMPLIIGVGCASQSTNRQSSTPAIQAAQEIPMEEVLDVGITVFDPGLPPQGQPMPDDVFPELRKAEARFQAVQLMETMQSTGQWGAVRVLPAGYGITDLASSMISSPLAPIGREAKIFSTSPCACAASSASILMIT